MTAGLTVRRKERSGIAGLMPKLPPSLSVLGVRGGLWVDEKGKKGNRGESRRNHSVMEDL